MTRTSLVFVFLSEKQQIARFARAFFIFVNFTNSRPAHDFEVVQTTRALDTELVRFFPFLCPKPNSCTTSLASEAAEKQKISRIAFFHIFSHDSLPMRIMIQNTTVQFSNLEISSPHSGIRSIKRIYCTSLFEICSYQRLSSNRIVWCYASQKPKLSQKHNQSRP